MTADGVMGRVRGSRRDPRKDKYGKISRRCRRHNWEDCHLESIPPSILPRPRARRRPLHLRSTDEYPDSGSGEPSGDSLARFHGLVLPRSRGLGDKQPSERSWVTSSVMVLGRRTCFSQWRIYPTSVAPILKMPRRIEGFTREGSSIMTDEINQSPSSSPMEGSLEASPLIAIHPLVEEKTNIMTLEELNALRDTYSFLPRVRIRLPNEGETITSTHPGEVAFYEAAFPAGLRFSLHPTIRLILQFYNICPAQLVPNAWRSIACSMALWWVYKYTVSLSEFRNLFSLNSNPKLDQGWLYFKVRKKKVLLGGYPSNVKGASRTAGNNLPNGDAPSSSSTVAMSKRISFKKIGEKLGKSTGKKKVTSSSKAPTTPTVASSRPGEGTSANLGTVLGPTASILGSPSVAERLLQGVIPPADKEKVEKLTLDQTAMKLFHVIGQEGRVASMETEVARLQKLAADLEQQLAESRAREQQANDELVKMKSDRDSLADKLERSGVLVNELREALDKAKESAVEEFKSSSEFVVAVEDSASKYFGEGFDFCKVQLRRHHPDLAIDFEGTVVDQDLLAEQDEAAEENEKEKLGENKG
ncbi:hypothetical protein Acr_12g0000720 [Actinidia rufa]|uniref:Uncharacterized protein n=1 Tax=Actinidia rufa TaxID=165716 RepID=A0A7J0FFT0_9ERIC|nr:hypothetical protein Acr_12g0000720 [Actinidia rufa]